MRGLRSRSAHLRVKTFSNSGWFEPEEFVVRIPRLGLEATVGTHTTILDALTDAGADLMYDCHKGECGVIRQSRSTRNKPRRGSGHGGPANSRYNFRPDHRLFLTRPALS